MIISNQKKQRLVEYINIHSPWVNTWKNYWLQLQLQIFWDLHQLCTCRSWYFYPFVSVQALAVEHCNFQVLPQIYSWIQGWALTGPFQHLESWCWNNPVLGCVFKAGVMLEGKALPRLNSLYLFDPINLALNLDQFSSVSSWKTKKPHNLMVQSPHFIPWMMFSVWWGMYDFCQM